MATVADLLRRHADLKAERSRYEGLWQDIADYIMPQRANITRTVTPGTKQTTDIYDSTAIHAARLLAASLHGTLTPSTQPWLSLKVRDEELNEEHEVRDWLEDTATRMHAAFNQSNFSQAAHEMFLDLVGASATGCLFLEEREPPASGQFGGFRFRAHPPQDYCVAEDAEGRVDTVFRHLKLTARAIVNKWGDQAGEAVATMAERKPDHPYTVVHAVYPRMDRQYATDGKPKRGARNMPWASAYLIEEPSHKIGEGGFEEMPFMVARWEKSAGEVYGRGPSHFAYPDVKSLNKTKEFLLQTAPLAMFPPTLERDDAVVGVVDLTPAGRNVVSGTGPIGEQLMFMQTGLKIDVSQIVLAELRQAILEMYYIPQLRLKDSPQMTATEVQARLEEMYRYLGPTLSRLQAEFLNPLVERAMGLMLRGRALAPLPRILAERAGHADLDIEYEGPLARAQRTVELVAQERVVNFVIALAQNRAQFPDPVWDILKVDDIIRSRAAVAGMKTDEIASADEVAELRKARAEQQQQQAQMAQAATIAEAAGKAAPAMKEMREGATAMNGGAA